MNQDPEVNSALSELKLEHVVFDTLSFNRIGYQQKEQNIKLKVCVSVNQYRVSLKVSVERESEYTAEVQVSGFCSISESCVAKDEILKKNAVAVLFPYVRSELTLLTAQPETTPIVLPVMNINAMIDNAE